MGSACVVAIVAAGMLKERLGQERATPHVGELPCASPRGQGGARRTSGSGFQAVKGSRTNSEGGLTVEGCEYVWRVRRQAEQCCVVRLSPAGDGAGRVEETCEKQERATWWMDVLVGGSGQGLFTWETKSSLAERHSFRQARVQEGATSSGGHVGICKTMQRPAIFTLLYAPGAVYRLSRASACRLLRAEESWRGHARPARRRLQRLSPALYA